MIYSRLIRFSIIVDTGSTAYRADLNEGKDFITLTVTNVTLMNLTATWNAEYIDAQYKLWKSKPESLSREWRLFFEGVEFAKQLARHKGQDDYDAVNYSSPMGATTHQAQKPRRRRATTIRSLRIQ